MNDTDNTTASPTRIAGREVVAFHPDRPGSDTVVTVELFRHGSPLRAAEPAGDTEWEARITTSLGQISSRGDSTWTALTRARRELEERGLLLAIAAARVDSSVLNPERRRGVTTVSWLSDHATKRAFGMFEVAARDMIGTVAQQRDHHDRWTSRPKESRR